MKNLWLLFLLTGILSVNTFAQVGINTDNSPPNNSSILDLKSTTLGFLPPRMSSSQMNAIGTPADGLTVYCTDCTPKGIYFYNGTKWTSASIPAHYIGELFGGGIVLWVDNTGQHGLIASLVNVSSGAAWSNIATVLIGSTAQSYWNGETNSAAIMAQSGHLNSAAKVCDIYTNDGYSDWYLPAIEQVEMIYPVRYVLNKNIASVPGATIFGDVSYWSSTEFSNNSAWYFDIFFGDLAPWDKAAGIPVRCVRNF
jgi:hypothetical protein